MSQVEHPRVALSIRQPWAWAIIHAGKDIENRSWSTNFRGRLHIHASKKFDLDGYDWIRLNARQLGIRRPLLNDMPTPSEFYRGGIIGAVTLADCVTHSPSRWFSGPYGFVLKDPMPTAAQIQCRGRLGIFQPDDETLALL